MNWPLHIFVRMCVLLCGAGVSVLAAEPSSPRPNILFAIADDMGHASAYGTPWVHTPNFDRLAEQGILFLNAYTPNAKCAPSRACILTGRNPWQNEAAGNHQPYYPAKFKSWMEALGDAGYDIGYTGKGWSPGILPPVRTNITGTLYEKHMLKPPARGICPVDYFANFKDFLADCPRDKPFCFWYGAREPHRGYEYGAGVSKGGYQLNDIDQVPSYWPDNDRVRNDMLDYAYEVAHYDEHLGKMIALLKEKGLLDNTLIIATSDNGPPFPRLKGFAFEQACHLPLAIMWPKGIKAPGRTCDAFISFIDFAPTLLELADVSPVSTGMQPITGRSFVDILMDRTNGPDRSTLIMGRERNDALARPGTESGTGYPVRSICSGNLLYVHNLEPDRWPGGNPDMGLKDTDGSPTKSEVVKSGKHSRVWQLCFGKYPADELFDLSADPECVDNLAAKPEYKATVAAMREELFKQLRQQNDLRMFGNGDVFDNYPSASPRVVKMRAEKEAQKAPVD